MTLGDDPTLKTPGQIRREIADELDHHVHEVERELVAKGYSPSEAKAEAERRFGDRSRHRAACERIQQGRRSSLARRHWWAGLHLDVRQAVRSVWRAPTFSAVAVATLAVCLGSATLVFALVDGVLLRPLGFERPEELVAVWQLRRDNGDHEYVSPANYVDWRERSQSFTGLAAVETSGMTLTALGDPVRVQVARVRGDFFAVFGRDPQAGRWLLPEDAESAAAVAVISHGFWQSYFAGRSDVLGQTVTLDGVDHEVVGVMPEGFAEPRVAQLWTPLSFDFDLPGSRGAQYLRVVGRLSPARSLGDAMAEVDSVARQLEAEYPSQLEGQGIALVPLRQSLVAGSKRPLWTLASAVALVLLLGVANVTALALAHGQARLPEHALRSAIGAGRRRILRQFTLEHLVLTTLGAGGGVLLAVGGLTVAKRLLPFDLPRLDEAAVGIRALCFALAVALVTAVIMGFWRTAQGRRSSLSAALRGSGGAVLMGRSRVGIVGVEIALAVILLSAAGLLLRSFTALTAVDPGFETQQILTFGLGLPASDYEKSRWCEVFSQLEERLERDGRVEAVGSSAWVPFEPGWFFSYRVSGSAPPADGERTPSCAFRPVSAGYFEALGIPVLAGRAFAVSDRVGGAPVVVVNAAFERANFGQGSAIGSRVVLGYGRDDLERTIVGVVEDVDQFGLGSGAAPTAYVPHLQEPFSQMTLVLRTNGDPESLQPVARAAVAQIDPRLAMERVETMERRVGASLDERRFVAGLLTTFAGLSLVIAFVGLHALVVQYLSGHRRELGIRRALGAQNQDVVSWIVRRVLLLVVPGVLVGLLGALGVGRLIRRQLFEIGPGDPVALVAAAVVLVLVGVVAALLPGLRATRNDPVQDLGA